LAILRFELPPDGPLAPLGLFERKLEAVWLEIGFGGGEHLVTLAQRHPTTGFIGVEPFMGGVAKLVARCVAEELTNIRLFIDDARLLLRALPDASIERCFALFPDPWPKPRHRKRRIINPVTAIELARVLRPGGELRVATDDRDYARAMLEALLARPELEWLARRASDWRQRPEDWPATRYEAKGLAAGRAPVFLRFARTAAQLDPEGGAGAQGSPLRNLPGSGI
jgi:tRNA (guanine-N7-)-methyltransferase